MTIKEIKSNLIGKTFIMYDSFHGDTTMFVIGYVANLKCGILIATKKNSVSEKCILTDDEVIKLITFGNATRYRCIDRCYFTDQFILSNIKL